MNPILSFHTTESARLDKAIALNLPEISRSQAAKLIESGLVTIDSVVALDQSRKLKIGEIIHVSVPPPESTQIKGTDIPIEIIYEDSQLLVINKQAGLTVHPAPGHYEDTLVNALIAKYGDDLSSVGGSTRPGIVHRLDKDTSGLMLVARTDSAHRALQKQLADRTLSRKYTAITLRIPNPTKGIITTQIGRHKTNRKKMAVLETGGKEAITEYKVLSTISSQLGVVECKLQTGRTHQIRVHMAHIGCPIVGDGVYGSVAKTSLKKLSTEFADAVWNFPRQALHAREISFIHPSSGDVMQFSGELPQDIKALIAAEN